MHFPRVMIAAPRSGSGKTLITCLVLKSLLREKLRISSFKCGPDYIDPMFHKRVLGIPSKNLDTFFTDVKKTRKLFMENASKSDISVIEGAMGLYDGIGGTSEKASAYDVARALHCPIIMVCDVKGMGGMSLTAQIRGFLDYDRDRLISAIILNGINIGSYEHVSKHIERELNIPVIGYIPFNKDLKFDSRHLGLIMPDEINNLNVTLELAAARFRQTVDFTKILEIADMAIDVEWERLRHQISQEPPVNIAIASDEAFRFYYEDNLDILRDFGANLVPFSPIHDEKLPDDVHGILLYGGYPEIYAKELSENVSMRQSILAAVNSGMPSIAECGGFMYLGASIEAQDGIAYPMVGAVNTKFYNRGKLVRFGYMSVTEKSTSFLGNGKAIRGHEFHYYTCNENGEDCIAYKPIRGKTWDCIFVGDNNWWGWPHLYYSSCATYAANFIRKCKRHAAGGGQFAERQQVL